ncbi:hypothetical protein [Amycolatopsis sp. H20-H5]|uniref:hypothetical protein n=1 Tax=Amycolatopsis sp. H20-H5 TaxID=3046309 RepID=UPI002DC04DE5|nr:hypothetical protein [Amycolatopsis sp. H20-H5]MEC3977889.1 hypothetical protein [Amycolatopsis sp. H20-H5]
MNEQRPSVGRDVHYVSHGTPPRADGSQAYTSLCRTAKITVVGAWIDVEISPLPPNGRQRKVTQTWDSTACALHVLNPTGEFFHSCQHDEGKLPGTWHWPERV